MYPHQSIYYSHPNNLHFNPPDLPNQPVTPIDLTYSQSMLPSNLLLSTPYFQPSSMPPMSQRQFFTPQSLGFHQPPNPSPHSAYLTQSNNNSNLDQLNLSRTVILKNLSDDLSLNELLNEIDYGPIEYCKMFSKPAPPHLKDVENLKTCYISFVNSKISINFHLKYSKNPYYLNKLKGQLKNSKYLKISLNESNNLNSSSNTIRKQDYIKLKTLNYILEFNATRCLLIRTNLNNATLVKSTESEIYNQCLKFGDVEDFKFSFNDSKMEAKALIHFTSIDSAIRTYEYYLKRIQIDKQHQIDQEGTDNDNLIKFKHVSFHKDRCDKTLIDKVKPSSSSSLNRRHSINNIPEEGDKDEKELNSELVFENNESIRNSLLSANDNSRILIDPISSNSSSSPIIDSASTSFISSYHNGYQSSQFRLQPTAPPPPTNNYQINPDPFNVGNRTIYLGNLHPNSTIEEIANNVRAGGLVESIRYHPDKKVCFITFIDPTIALKFYLNHQVLHQLIIHGYNITVGWAKNHSGPLSREISLAVTAGASRNVYIGIKLNKDGNQEENLKLPSESELRNDFSKLGELEQINFYHNKDCGFLNFLNILDAIRVVELFESKNVSKINKIVEDNGEFYDKYKNFKISFAKDRCGNPPKFNFKKRSNNYKKKSVKPDSKSTEKIEDENTGEMITEEAAMVFGIISAEEDKKELPNEEPEIVSKGPEGAQEQLIEGSNDDVDDNGKENEADDDNKEFEEDEEDDEDDDDVSIIIGSDDTSSTTAHNSNKEGPKKYPNHKIYHNKFSSSESFTPIKKSSRNSSNLSLNSNYLKFYNQPQTKFPSSPFIQQQSLHYMPNQQRQSNIRLQPPPQHVNSYSNSFYSNHLPSVPPQLYSANHSKNLYSTSGSQVMAQYLAKSQHDSLLYAANILSNDVGIDEDSEYNYKNYNSSGRRHSRK